METRMLGRNKPQKLRIKAFCVTLLLMFFVLSIGGLPVSYLEEWSFKEGIYAWFATLSTIGYGDYIPAWNIIKKLWWHQNLVDYFRVGSTNYSGILRGQRSADFTLVEALEELRIQFDIRNVCTRCKKNKCAKLGRHDDNEMRLTRQTNNQISLNVMVKPRVRSASIWDKTLRNRQ